MIVTSIYYGDKADVWSMAGIGLELFFGNERFTNYWMGAYEYEIMQNKDNFAIEIAKTVKLLPNNLKDQDPKLSDFLISFTNMDDKARPTVAKMMEHPYIASSVKKMQATSS